MRNESLTLSSKEHSNKKKVQSLRFVMPMANSSHLRAWTEHRFRRFAWPRTRLGPRLGNENPPKISATKSAIPKKVLTSLSMETKGLSGGAAEFPSGEMDR